MRIGDAAGAVQAAQRTPWATGATTARGAAAALSQPASSDADAVQRADFSSMTRQGLMDWMNTQIKSGEMSLDDSSGFLGMTLKMPVGGPSQSPSAGLDAQEQVDFIQLARDGISWARQHNEQAQLRSLQTALDIMQTQQGAAIGVDVHA